MNQLCKIWMSAQRGQSCRSPRSLIPPEVGARLVFPVLPLRGLCFRLDRKAQAYESGDDQGSSTRRRTSRQVSPSPNQVAQSAMDSRSIRSACTFKTPAISRMCFSEPPSLKYSSFFRITSSGAANLTSKPEPRRACTPLPSWVRLNSLSSGMKTSILMPDSKSVLSG